jgi:hypothetical protein
MMVVQQVLPGNSKKNQAVADQSGAEFVKEVNGELAPKSFRPPGSTDTTRLAT